MTIVHIKRSPVAKNPLALIWQGTLNYNMKPFNGDVTHFSTLTAWHPQKRAGDRCSCKFIRVRLLCWDARPVGWAW